ncbi:MAG TPA: anti-sigma factor [Actinomycetota bacterium]|jgi:anti-sigma-K factor RskA|nr:anti-sigma factor [Actinomycetota bacterium]
MTVDHSLIEELMAADALGGLDPADRELLSVERTAHGTCHECARIETEFAETAGRLGFALDPIPVDDSLADDILRRAVADAPAPPATDVVDLTRARERRAPWRALVAVAAAFVLVVGYAIVRNPSGDTAVLQGAGRPERLEVTFSPGEPGATLSGTGFERLPEGRVYELWAIRDDTPIKATCFNPEDGNVELDINARIETGDLMAVTVEPACASAPTTAPIITADTSELS